MRYLSFRFLFAILFVLALSIVPLPQWLSSFRPQWILLFTLYLQFFMPAYFRLVFLLILSFVVDILLATTIGEHGFALMLTCWLAAGKARRFQLFPLGQQILFIFLLSLVHQFIILITDAFLGYHYSLMMSVCSALLTTLAWPWSTLFIKGYFSHFNKTSFPKLA